MTDLQILNKVIQTKNYDIISKNNLDVSFFTEYEDEYNFIKEHIDKYGKVPDRDTFAAKFRDFPEQIVEETDEYLVKEIKEEKFYKKFKDTILKTEDIFRKDAHSAYDFITNELPRVKVENQIKSVDIVKNADIRLKEFEEKANSPDKQYISTGLKELDDIIHGWAPGEEFGVIFARIGNGKSWLLTKTLTAAWESGKRVGFISPEMGASKIGYRFDTLHGQFSNTPLNWAQKEQINYEKYKDYIEELSKKEGFIVSTPHDFNKVITVSRIRNWIKDNNFDIVGIDGIKYLQDERYRKGDNLTISLTNISEDLMELSCELGIPILVVVQSNRAGVDKDNPEEMPDLENIKDSDGIGANATKILAVKQTADGRMKISVRKHRDGDKGKDLIYTWSSVDGEFKYYSEDTSEDIMGLPTNNSIKIEPSDIGEPITSEDKIKAQIQPQIDIGKDKNEEIF